MIAQVTTTSAPTMLSTPRTVPDAPGNTNARTPITIPGTSHSTR